MMERLLAKAVAIGAARAETIERRAMELAREELPVDLPPADARVRGFALLLKGLIR